MWKDIVDNMVVIEEELPIITPSEEPIINYVVPDTPSVPTPPPGPRPIPESPVIQGLGRYSSGKSFEFANWRTLTKYQNSDAQQDFVSYNGTLLACKRTHISDSAPVLIWNDSGEAVGVDSEVWEFVFGARRGLKGDPGPKMEWEDITEEDKADIINRFVETASEEVEGYKEAIVEASQSINDSAAEARDAVAAIQGIQAIYGTPIVTCTQSQYDEFVEEGTVRQDTLYYIIEDDTI